MGENHVVQGTIDNREKRKVVFVHAPKTGGSAINQWLKRHNRKYNFWYLTGHQTIDVLLKKQPKAYRKLEPFITFAVRRNTYDRMMSIYNFVENNFTIKYGWGGSKHDDTLEARELVKEAHAKGIAYFIEWMHNHKISRFQTWHKPQTEWTKGVNWVLQYENLNSQFQIIKDSLNVPEPLGRFNVIPYYHRKSDLYTQDYVNVIQKYYGEEIEKYKYLPKKCLTS